MTDHVDDTEDLARVDVLGARMLGVLTQHGLALPKHAPQTANLLRDLAAAAVEELMPGTNSQSHLVRITDEFLANARFFTEDGHLLTLEFGEPYPNGTVDLVLRSQDEPSLFERAAQQLEAEPNPYPRLSWLERRGFEQGRAVAARIIR